MEDSKRPQTKAKSTRQTTHLYNQYGALIGDGRAGAEAPSCERGVHVRTCRCTPHLTCESLSSNGQWVPSHTLSSNAICPAVCEIRKDVYARAHVQMHPKSDLCKGLIYWVPSHKTNLNAIRSAVCENWKRVCTCARADALHLRHV